MFSANVVRTTESLKVMPEALDKLVKKLIAKGYSSKSAWAIATSTLRKKKKNVKRKPKRKN